MFLRLRQLCLVAHDLDSVVQDLQAVFDVSVSRRNPGLARFGVENAVLPFATSFIEVIAPIRDGTSAGRYLERRQGDGGYMVILDSEDLERWRRHVESIGVRIAEELANDDYWDLQFHPRDTGGALLEINRSRNGERLDGGYGPAGPDWKSYMKTGTVKGVLSAELQSDDPVRLARRWSEILRSPAEEVDGRLRITLDTGCLEFVMAGDGRGEGLSAVEVEVADPEVVLERAGRRGLQTDGDAVIVGGVRFDLVTGA